MDKMAAASAAGTPPDLMMNDQAVTNLQQLKVVDPVDDVVADITALFGDTSARQKNDFIFPDKHLVLRTLLPAL